METKDAAVLSLIAVKIEGQIHTELSPAQSKGKMFIFMANIPLYYSRVQNRNYVRFKS